MVSVGAKKQAGFGVVAIVVAVLVIAVLGLIGWRLYNLYSKPVAKTNTTSQVNTQANTTSNTGTSNQAMYLDIKELGIKIKLDDSIKDAVYSAYTDSSGNPYAYISTTSLTNASNGSCGSQKGGFASISETKGTPPEVLGTTLQPNGTTVFKLGTDTYVYIGSPNGQCSQDNAVNDLFSTQHQVFFDDFKTVQLDN